MDGDNQQKWAEFDAVLKSNRVRDELRTEAASHPSVQFLEVGFGDPWADGWGMFAGDPIFDDWVAAINDYRREREAQDSVLFNGLGATGKQAEVGAGVE